MAGEKKTHSECRQGGQSGDQIACTRDTDLRVICLISVGANLYSTSIRKSRLLAYLVLV